MNAYRYCRVPKDNEVSLNFKDCTNFEKGFFDLELYILKSQCKIEMLLIYNSPITENSEELPNLN